jgi:hypothetical protein
MSSSSCGWFKPGQLRITHQSTILFAVSKGLLPLPYSTFTPQVHRSHLDQPAEVWSSMSGSGSSTQQLQRRLRGMGRRWSLDADFYLFKHLAEERSLASMTSSASASQRQQRTWLQS